MQEQKQRQKRLVPTNEEAIRFTHVLSNLLRQKKLKGVRQRTKEWKFEDKKEERIKIRIKKKE